jgi:hypothetical protein|tara:strand:- start:628 stop:801 length:174 start_codon:yes stop_codon:yes gene_type:complete
MASRRIYKGSPCKVDCGGHRAGAAYARKGGSQPSRYSPSFNKGMKIAQGGKARRSTR